LRRPRVPADGLEHRVVRRGGREREAGPGPAALGNPRLPLPVDPCPRRPVPDSLGHSRAARHSLVPLDAQLPVGDLQSPVDQARLRLGAVARPARHGPRVRHHLPHLEVPAVLDDHLPRRPAGHPERAVRGGRHRRRRRRPELLLDHVPAPQEPVPHLHAALDGVHPRRFHGAMAPHGWRAGGHHPRAGHARLSLHLCHGPPGVGPVDLRRRLAGHPAVHRHADAMGEDMKRHQPGLRLAMLALTVVILMWTLFPVYYMVLLSLTPTNDLFQPALYIDNPTLRNYVYTMGQDNPFVRYFWQQLLT